MTLADFLTPGKKKVAKKELSRAGRGATGAPAVLADYAAEGKMFTDDDVARDPTYKMLAEDDEQADRELDGTVTAAALLRAMDEATGTVGFTREREALRRALAALPEVVE